MLALKGRLRQRTRAVLRVRQRLESPRCFISLRSVALAPSGRLRQRGGKLQHDRIFLRKSYLNYIDGLTGNKLLDFFAILNTFF